MSSELETLHMSFNRDGTSLSVGTEEDCFHVSTATPEKPERLPYRSTHGVKIICRLGRSCLVALVTVSNPRKLRIFNIIKNGEICDYAYKDSIISVRLNRLTMVVCLETKIYIHSLESMKVLHVINTCSNPQGVVALTEDQGVNLLAFPASEQKGDVQIFDVSALQIRRYILAQELFLAYLEFNGSGTLLASASKEGTQILIFDMDGTCVHKLHRGFSSVDVYNMSFSFDDSFLAVTSSNPTIHIFRLSESSNCDKQTEKQVKPADQISKSNVLSTADSAQHQQNSTNPSTNNCKTEEEGQTSTSTATGAETNSDDSYYSWSSWVDWAKVTLAPMLPDTSNLTDFNALTESWTGAKRSFAYIKSPLHKGTRNVVAVTTAYTQDGPEGRVIVGAYDGFLYIYRLDTQTGGECQLLKQVKLVGEDPTDS